MMKLLAGLMLLNDVGAGRFALTTRRRLRARGGAAAAGHAAAARNPRVARWLPRCTAALAGAHASASVAIGLHLAKM